MNHTPTILIIDDEEMIRESLIDILEDENYHTLTAENAETARQQYADGNPDLILLDIWMPDTDGITLLREWHNNHNLTCPIIMMSGHGTIETAVEATKLGAYYFLEKPLSTSKLLLTIKRALETQALVTQNAALKAQIDPPADLIGKSPIIQTLRDQALTLAKQNVPLYINGPSGSGKQHLARYIHQHSAQKNGKFIAFDLETTEPTAIIPALTGNTNQTGLFTQAAGGTLYLNDISQLPDDAQTLLTHLIENQSYTTNDGKRYENLNIRIITSGELPHTHLKEHLHTHLYDHLTIATISLPALQDHSADVPDLLEHFSKTFADHDALPYRQFTLAAQNALRQHHWPGNIRELKNLVQRLLLKNDAPEIDTAEAEAALTLVAAIPSDNLWRQFIPVELSLKEARDRFEYLYLSEQFRLCEGNVAKLANRVGMERTNLYRKLRSLKIEPTEKPD